MRWLCFPLALMFCQSLAAASPELEEALEGFDQNEPVDVLDETLQGFEDRNVKSPTDELLQGFDDPAVLQDLSDTSTPRKWHFSGWSSVSASYNYQQPRPSAGEADFRGLSRARVKIQPELKYRFAGKASAFVSASAFHDFSFALNGRDQYTRELLRDMEREVELREAHVDVTLTENTDLRIGRQIVVWGKSDSLRVVDVLNPLDFREPGMVDIEDLRLPVTMLKADYYFSDWRSSLVWLPEIRFDKRPAWGSEFYFSKNKAAQEVVPASGLANSEIALALEGSFTGWDISLHLANLYDDNPYVAGEGVSARRKHTRVNMAGLAVNAVSGVWLWKSEMALFDGLRASAGEYDRFDMMIGVDYSGLPDHTFALEAVNRHILDYDVDLNAGGAPLNQDSSQFALRYTGNYLREKLQIVMLASVFGKYGEDGGFYRASAEYELAQALSLTLGLVVYQAGDNGNFNAVATNDRLFADLRYDF